MAHPWIQNGYALYDDVNGRKITGLAEFSGLVDVDNPLPLTFTERYALTEATAELATACYAGVLLLQAMGLAAQRRERARIRSERHQRWGRPRQPKAA